MSQENILVDKSGRARLSDSGLAGVASLNCMETSTLGLEGAYRWMAPELFGVVENGSKPRAPTPQTDIFAFGMVAIEVIVSYYPNSSPLTCHIQVFTGQVPFPDDSPLMVMKKVMDGERPPQPRIMSGFGLSKELWAAVQSSWAPEVANRHSVSAFVSLLERATPDICSLRALTKFDANSGDHNKKLRNLLGCGDNALLGMREEDSLILIEVFDQVGFTVLCLLPLPNSDMLWF